MPRLKTVDCSEPGITRRRCGKGLTYLAPDGSKVSAEHRAWIEQLAIPPAWRDVWICPQRNGHLQATGIDDAGRRQYLYHPRWHELRSRKKFDHMVEFAAFLPQLRRQVTRDLGRDSLSREQVLACGVRLLDRGFFRVGGEDYAEQNGTFGLATIRREHVRVHEETIEFDYLAKGSKRRVQTLHDSQVGEIICQLKRRRSKNPELLAYKHGRRWVDIKSSDLNAYIKRHTDESCSAKDFRTWNATVLAAAYLARNAPQAHSKTARKKVVVEATREVAEYLGNTLAVCRSSYIDPRVFEHFRAHEVIHLPARTNGSTQRQLESEVLRLLAEDCVT